MQRTYRWRTARRGELLIMFAERGWQRPYEVALLLICLFGGVVGLVIQTPTSGVVTAAFGPYDAVWYVGNIIGSAVALAALQFPTAMGLLWERAGLIALTGWLLAFAFAGLAQDSRGAVTASFFIGAFGLSNFHRCFQISVDLYELEGLHRRAEQTRDDDAASGDDP